MASAKQRECLARADVVLNVMAEPDGHADDLIVAAELLSDVEAAIINHPMRILGTARDLVARAFATRTDLLVPRVVRLTFPFSDGSIEAIGLDFPILARPVGSHSGVCLTKITHPKDFEIFINKHGDRDIYISPYIGFARKDGLFRKARVYWIGDHSVPEHYYISSSWNVHGGTSRELMARNSWMGEEVISFLRGFQNSDIAKSLMPEIAAKLALDLFMVDLGLAEDGRLILFEANCATCAILSTELEQEGVHLEPYVRTIKEDFNNLVSMRMATRGS